MDNRGISTQPTGAIESIVVLRVGSHHTLTARRAGDSAFDQRSHRATAKLLAAV